MEDTGPAGHNAPNSALKDPAEMPSDNVCSAIGATMLYRRSGSCRTQQLYGIGAICDCGALG